MEKPEIKRINAFLNDVQETICEQDPPHVLQLQLNELYRVIKTLMDETFKAKDQKLKIVLALLEKRAREYKQEIEERLATRN
ncbi:MAG TPA: hypothetical protein VMW72_21475 [Sedimentisphaerales bacterium]|nr:hypothetical protein [Sedimentisphaerales bacterium]